MEKIVSQAISSLDPLPPAIRHGMIAMGTCGIVSFITTFGLFIFITHRMIHWRQYFSSSVAHNQAFILIYNLLIADLQQAGSFVISFYWISQNKLVGPNWICDAQGWLIQVGDVASSLWILAIAIQTFINLVCEKTISHRAFVFSICFVWNLVVVLAVIGPLQDPVSFYVPAGAWCWIGPKDHLKQFSLYYVWIFISQLGSLFLYTFVFVYLRARIRHSSLGSSAQSSYNPAATSAIDVEQFDPSKSVPSATILSSASRNNDAIVFWRARIRRTVWYMMVYPCTYSVLILPLAVGRVSLMLGATVPESFFPVAGALMACCGFVDVILFLVTRNSLVKNTLGWKSTVERYATASESELVCLDSVGMKIRTADSGIEPDGLT